MKKHDCRTSFWRSAKSRYENCNFVGFAWILRSKNFVYRKVQYSIKQHLITTIIGINIINYIIGIIKNITCFHVSIPSTIVVGCLIGMSGFQGRLILFRRLGVLDRFRFRLCKKRALRSMCEVATRMLRHKRRISFYCLNNSRSGIL